MPPTAPTTELGAPARGLQPTGQGLALFGGGLFEIEERDANVDLAWPRSVETFARMINDAQLDGLARGTVLPIRNYHWWLDPNGARPEVVQRISADYNLPIGPDQRINLRRSQGRFRFDRHLEDALRAPTTYGHYFFEQVYRVLQDGPPELNGGWQAHLRKLAPRPPRTISAIKAAPDGGLAHIKVPALQPQTRSGVDLARDVEIPVERLVAYVWDMEGANWRGRPMIRSSYFPWKRKERVMVVGAINIERAGGVPYAVAPKDADEKTMQKLHALARGFRVGQDAGAALPYGAELKFASAAGGSEAIEYVRLQNEEMARGWLRMLVQLGQTETGSRALGSEFSDVADIVQQTIATWFAGVFSEHVIEDDVDLNEGPGEEFVPLLRFTPAGSPTAGLEEALEEAASEGALPSGSEAVGIVRGAAGGPARRGPFREVTAATRRPAEPPFRREPTDFEVAAATDFETMQATWVEAREQLVADYRAQVQDPQVDEIAAQIQAADSLEDLAAVIATAAGGTVIFLAAIGLMVAGAEAAAAELAAQGAEVAAAGAVAAALAAGLLAARDRDTVADMQQAVTDELDEAGLGAPGPVLADVERFAATADAQARLLAQSLSEAGARRAVTRQPGHGDDRDALADDVAEHLRGLSDAHLEEQLGGTLTGGQNAGRFAAMGEVEVTGARMEFRASEILDDDTCEDCRDIDGTEFESVDEARVNYPAGWYFGCAGGMRCRGTVAAQLVLEV